MDHNRDGYSHEFVAHANGRNSKPLVCEFDRFIDAIDWIYDQHPISAVVMRRFSSRTHTRYEQVWSILFRGRRIEIPEHYDNRCIILPYDDWLSEKAK